jgi:hypothetical protein
MEFEESKKLNAESRSFDMYDGLFKAYETYHPQFKDFDILE